MLTFVCAGSTSVSVAGLDLHLVCVSSVYDKYVEYVLSPPTTCGRSEQSEDSKWIRSSTGARIHGRERICVEESFFARESSSGNSFASKSFASIIVKSRSSSMVAISDVTHFVGFRLRLADCRAIVTA